MWFVYVFYFRDLSFYLLKMMFHWSTKTLWKLKQGIYLNYHSANLFTQFFYFMLPLCALPFFHSLSLFCFYDYCNPELIQTNNKDHTQDIYSTSIYSTFHLNIFLLWETQSTKVTLTLHSHLNHWLLASYLVWQVGRVRVLSIPFSFLSCSDLWCKRCFVTNSVSVSLTRLPLDLFLTSFWISRFISSWFFRVCILVWVFRPNFILWSLFLWSFVYCCTEPETWGVHEIASTLLIISSLIMYSALINFFSAKSSHVILLLFLFFCKIQIQIKFDLLWSLKEYPKLLCL